MKKLAFLFILAVACVMPQRARADLQYLFGVESLIGKTSADGSLSGMIVRLGKFQPGFTPTAGNYDQWINNFIRLTSADVSLVSDPDAFVVPVAPDTGPWKMATKTQAVTFGNDPAGFSNGDQIYLWIANSLVGSATTQVALLTDPSWAYTTATNTPQTNVTFALSNESPTLVVGTLFNDHFLDVSSNLGIRLVTQNIPATGPAPEIAVQQPTGTELFSGISTSAFGSVNKGTTVSRTYTIKNTGNVDLVLPTNAVTIDNVSPVGNTMFSVTVQPGTTVVAGSSTTFEVQCAPVDANAVSAQVHIASNDADEPSFTIGLTGTGVVSPGALSFANTVTVVKEEAGPAVVRINRTGGTAGTIKVNVSTSNGNALSGFDYTGLVNQVITFNDGDSFVDVPITIQNGSLGQSNRTFTVALSTTGLGVEAATLVAPTTATVRIIDSTDLTKPTAPAVSYPAANAVLDLAVGAAINVTGSATDNKGIKKVQIALNGNPLPADATLSTPWATFSSYTQSITPAGGGNVLTVKTTDTRDNVSIITTRTFTVRRLLTVAVSGPLGSGTVSTGFVPSSYREIGKSYTITATPSASPAPGFVFDGWTVSGGPTVSDIGVTTAALEQPAMTFVFREGLVLTARFIANPFAAVAGTYTGLAQASTTLPDRGPRGSVGPEDGSVASHSTEGLFTGTVQTNGAFTGSLKMDGFLLSVSGVFDNSGLARFGVARATSVTLSRTGKTSVSVALRLNPGSAASNTDDLIEGTVTQNYRSAITAVSSVMAARAYYNGLTAATTVPDAYLKVAGTTKSNGVFTIVLPAKDPAAQPPEFTAVDYPQGTGYGTMNVSKTGVVTFTGTLADGTAISASAPVSRQGNVIMWPLYAEMYSKAGSLSGYVAFDASQSLSDVSATDSTAALKWFRPFLDSQHYPYGWPEGVKLDLLGAKYTAVGGQSVLPGLDDPSRLADLQFASGPFDTAIGRLVSISIADQVTKLPASDPSYALSITRSSGLLSGSFVPPGTVTKLSFQGIIYQKGGAAQAGGHGFILSATPKVKDYTGQSGRVNLKPQ